MAGVSLLLRRAAAGTGGVLVVHGPPGAGRTTLADAAAAQGRQLGFAVLRVAALAAGKIHRNLAGRPGEEAVMAAKSHTTAGAPGRPGRSCLEGADR